MALCEMHVAMVKVANFAQGFVCSLVSEPLPRPKPNDEATSARMRQVAFRVWLAFVSRDWLYRSSVSFQGLSYWLYSFCRLARPVSMTGNIKYAKPILGQ